MSGLPPDRGPLEDFAAGLARGTFEAVGPGVREYAALLFNRRLAFIGRRDYIAEVKAQRQSPEWLLFREYVKNPKLSLLAQMGLTLREWESDSARKKDIEQLRSRIHAKYGEEGLHIAQVVQSRILTGVVPAVVGAVATKERAAKLIESFLDASYRLCRFIQEKDPAATIARAVGDHLTVDRPPLFVLFARGSAVATCSRIVKVISEAHREYALQVSDLFKSRIVVLVRNDLYPSSPRL